MDYKNKEKNLLVKLGGFSKNMVQNHHLENLSEFVMHDLCSQETFNLPKAAYLVNNPDFTCLKGVAGYHAPESFKKGSSWQSQQDFTSHMKNASFNQAVRGVNGQHVDRSNAAAQQAKIDELARLFEMSNPQAHVWTLKHDNQGIFIFEQDQNSDLVQDHLLDFLHMLSFCGIF